MHYYQHHIGDFLRDAGSLPNEYLGAYMRLLWRYYVDETPISGDLEDIAFDASSTPEITRQLLRKFFVRADEGWRHKRCDEEIAAYHEKSAKASESASARWRNKKPCDEDADAMRTHTERNANASKNDATDDANQEPITNNQVKNKIKNKTRTPSAPAQIDFSSWPNEPSQPVLDEWLAHRKRKKAAITPLVIQQHGKQLHEAARNGWTVDECLMQVVARNWQGLEASWLPQRRNGTGPPNGSKPSAADDFRGKTYRGTPDNELPDFLRPEATHAG